MDSSEGIGDGARTDAGHVVFTAGPNVRARTGEQDLVSMYRAESVAGSSSWRDTRFRFTSPKASSGATPQVA
jgi:hypothetical protein